MFRGVITAHGEEVCSSSLPSVEQLKELLEVHDLSDELKFIGEMIDKLKKQLSDQDIKNFIGFIQGKLGESILGKEVLPSKFISWYEAWLKKHENLNTELLEAFSDNPQMRERANYADTLGNLIQKFADKDKGILLSNLLCVYYHGDLRNTLGTGFDLFTKFDVYDFAKILDKVELLMIKDKRNLYVHNGKRDIGFLRDVMVRVKDYVFYGMPDWSDVKEEFFGYSLEEDLLEMSVNVEKKLAKIKDSFEGFVDMFVDNSDYKEILMHMFAMMNLYLYGGGKETYGLEITIRDFSLILDEFKKKRIELDEDVSWLRPIMKRVKKYVSSWSAGLTETEKSC